MSFLWIKIIIINSIELINTKKNPTTGINDTHPFAMTSITTHHTGQTNNKRGHLVRKNKFRESSIDYRERGFMHGVCIPHRIPRALEQQGWSEGEARGRSRHKNNSNRVVRKERGGMKWKDPTKQGLTSSEVHITPTLHHTNLSLYHTHLPLHHTHLPNYMTHLPHYMTHLPLHHTHLLHYTTHSSHTTPHTLPTLHHTHLPYYSHSRDIFLREGVCSVGDEHACLAHSSIPHNNTLDGAARWHLK